MKDLSRYMELFKPVYSAVVEEPECEYFVMGQGQGVDKEEIELWWCEGWKRDLDWFFNVSS